jgi:translation initiation factor IF-2
VAAAGFAAAGPGARHPVRILRRQPEFIPRLREPARRDRRSAVRADRQLPQHAKHPPPGVQFPPRRRAPALPGPAGPAAGGLRICRLAEPNQTTAQGAAPAGVRRERRLPGHRDPDAAFRGAHAAQGRPVPRQFHADCQADPTAQPHPGQQRAHLQGPGEPGGDPGGGGRAGRTAAGGGAVCGLFAGAHVSCGFGGGGAGGGDEGEDNWDGLVNMTSEHWKGSLLKSW